MAKKIKKAASKPAKKPAKAKPQKPAPKKAAPKKVVKAAKPAPKKVVKASKPAPKKVEKVLPKKTVVAKAQAPVKKVAPVPTKPEPKKIEAKKPEVVVKSAPAPVAVSAKAAKNGEKPVVPKKVEAPRAKPIEMDLPPLRPVVERPESAVGPIRERPEGEELFSVDEIEFFRTLLMTEKRKLLEKARQTLETGGVKLEKEEMYDELDLASATVDQALVFKLMDRDRKLLGEIEHALTKIDTGDYGYCEGTGEPIPKRRLELRPWTKHSVKYKEYLERTKKSGRGVVDEEESMSGSGGTNT